MGRGKIKKIKPVSLQARKAAIAQQQQLQAQKAALERQIAEERSKQARLQREIEEKERLVRGLERVGASSAAAAAAAAEEAYNYPAPSPPPPWNTSSYPQDFQQQLQLSQMLQQPAASHADGVSPISDKALSMLNHMLGSRGSMQRSATTGGIDVVLSQEGIMSAASGSSYPGNTTGMTSYDPSSLFTGMQGIFAGEVDDEGMLDQGGSETNVETKEALAEAMAAMKAAAHVAKALPLMILKSATQAMTQHGGAAKWTCPPAPSDANHPNTITEAHMVLDPRTIDQNLLEFRAMLEDPEERMRLGIGIEMLGWAVGDAPTDMPDNMQRQVQGYPPSGNNAGEWDGQTGGERTAHDVDPVPALEDMLKLPIFNNEAFRSSPLFGKSVSSPDGHTHHSQATPGDLYLESLMDAHGSTSMDQHNIDLMQDFLSSASGMLDGAIFGGAQGGTRDERSASTASGEANHGHPPPPQQARPGHPPVQRGVPTDIAEYPGGEMTASEAVRAVTELLEASSRKLQKVTGEHGQEGDGTVRGRDVDVRLDGSHQQRGTQHVHAALPTAPVAASSNISSAAAHAILQARATSSGTAMDETEDSDIDAFSVIGDPMAFPDGEYPDEDEDDDEAYYSDEDYEEEEYYEDGERIVYTTDEDGQGGSSRYTSSEGREGETYYDSEGEEVDDDDDEVYESGEQLAEYTRRQDLAAGIPPHATQGGSTTNSSIPNSVEQRSSGTLRAPASTGQAAPTPTPTPTPTQRHPLSGQQMLEILQRMSPEARRNYQAALTREKMEYEKRQQGGSAEVLPPPPPPLPHSQAHPQAQAQYQHSHIQTQQQARHTARQAAPSLPAPPQQKVPSVLDDPAIMASILSLPCTLPRTTPG
ncbi:hypothetical protein QFC24_005229 [Naganishia onofrii]|uniref:Uncharacterized protein n=1 Tax=Naganishia onofrii TaxID=1851511 RepID=A0ACC2X9R5_9TREE|nr:hypothetical protein QFC24_005229 [Naganishia onofrii]